MAAVRRKSKMGSLVSSMLQLRHCWKMLLPWPTMLWGFRVRAPLALIIAQSTLMGKKLLTWEERLSQSGQISRLGQVE